MLYKFFNQHTLKRSVWCQGIGLHSGAKVTLRLKPAPPNFGIQFRRMDLSGQPTIAAHYYQVADTFLATSIGGQGVVVSTVEHLMAALFGSSVDNALVEINGPEVPVLDGSAAPYIEVIEEAGIEAQEASRRYLTVERPMVVKEADAYIKVRPSDQFRVRYSIDFPHPLVGCQELSWSFDEDAFRREIAGARTFGFLKDVRKLQNMGLAQGGSLSNALVFDDFQLLNPEGLRYTNECVRHKILDLIGDLSLAGMPLLGEFEVCKAGHALHNRFLKQLMGQPGYHSVVVPHCLPITPFFASSKLRGFVHPTAPLGKPL